MQVKMQQLEPDIKQWTGFKLRKKYIKTVYCYFVYLTSMQSTSCNSGLDKSQAGTKIARRDIKGTFCPNTGTIKDINGRDLADTEEIKRRWKEYTEELC